MTCFIPEDFLLSNGFEVLHQDKLVSPEACKEMIGHLRKQDIEVAVLAIVWGSNFLFMKWSTDVISAGQTALLEVTRGSTVIGSAKAVISGTDVALHIEGGEHVGRGRVVSGCRAAVDVQVVGNRGQRRATDADHHRSDAEFDHVRADAGIGLLDCRPQRALHRPASGDVANVVARRQVASIGQAVDREGRCRRGAGDGNRDQYGQDDQPAAPREGMRERGGQLARCGSVGDHLGSTLSEGSRGEGGS